MTKKKYFNFKTYFILKFFIEWNRAKQNILFFLYLVVVTAFVQTASTHG